MTLDPQGTKLIELTSYVAQQVQMKSHLEGPHLAYLAQIFRRGANVNDLLHALIKSLDVPQVERMLRKIQITMHLASLLTFLVKG